MRFGSKGCDSHFIAKNRFSFGRDSRCNFYLDDPIVSRLHASLEVNAVNCTRIVDLSSRNGVFVNGQRVDVERYLQHLDIFTIGQYKFRFVESSIYSDFNLRFIRLWFFRDNTLPVYQKFSTTRHEQLELFCSRLRRITTQRSVHFQSTSGNGVAFHSICYQKRESYVT